MTWAVLLEIYGEYGMKFEEATRELEKAIGDDTPQQSAARKAPEPNNDQSLVMLQAMMGDSDFRGPRG